MPTPTSKTNIASQAHAANGVDAATKKANARKRFEGVWEVIRAELLAHFDSNGMPKDAREWYKRVSCGRDWVDR